MKIVILDGHTSNPGDLSWEGIEELGQLTVYPRTSDDEVHERAKGAEVLVVNKRVLGKKELSKLPDVKCICTLATGYNNIDVSYAKERGITVCNAVGYSSPSVAQHVMAMILHHYNRMDQYFKDVREGKWSSSVDFTFYDHPFAEIQDRKIGIYGYGKIGQTVGDIVRSMGMKVLVISRGAAKDIYDEVTYLSEDDFLKESDVITLHAPLSEENANFINTERLTKMKKSAILVNTGRGGLINEVELRKALENEEIGAAYLDVLTQEPPPSDHILLSAPRCYITPHIAWATPSSRARLIDIVAQNIKCFKEGKPQNVVV